MFLRREWEKMLIFRGDFEEKKPYQDSKNYFMESISTKDVKYKKMKKEKISWLIYVFPYNSPCHAPQQVWRLVSASWATVRTSQYQRVTVRRRLCVPWFSHRKRPRSCTAPSPISGRKEHKITSLRISRPSSLGIFSVAKESFSDLGWSEIPPFFHKMEHNPLPVCKSFIAPVLGAWFAIRGLLELLSEESVGKYMLRWAS